MRFLWLPFVLVALGCAPARGGNSSTPSSDAGTSSDALLDTGAPPTDTGTPPADTGTPPVDTGTALPDAAVPTDLGPPPTDAPVCIASPETSAGSCADGVDNDCDTLRDCLDPDCRPHCTAPDSGPPPPVDAGCVPSVENTPGRCNDGVDNDCDGFVDCNDFDCSRNPDLSICPRDAGPGPIDTGVVCVPSPEGTNFACNDGIDNDCDGFVDCIDFDCSRNISVTVCRDGGAGCIPTAEDTNFACSDGVDNDCDGFADCVDFDCTRLGTPVTVCRDAGAPVDVGQYRDAGPRADAASCVRTGDENTFGVCNDGVDNDCDGYVDCADRNCSCIGSCAPALLGCTCRGAEATNAACTDRIDNDCNGFLDCSDFACSRNPAVTVCGIN